MANTEFDVVVVGAGTKDTKIYTTLRLTIGNPGLSGLAFSRFYLDTHTKCKLAILEEDTRVGGVWSACMARPPTSRQCALPIMSEHSSALQWLLVPERTENVRIL